MNRHGTRFPEGVAMLGKSYRKVDCVDGAEKEERKRQACDDGVQQQKRVTGFCRVPARARLTACKKPPDHVALTSPETASCWGYILSNSVVE